MKLVIRTEDLLVYDDVQIVEAIDVKLAEEKIKKKNPDCEVYRISSDRHKLDYYSVMKKRTK